MRDSYWIIDGVLAGSTGPNLSEWDYGEISAKGYVAILSVNNGDMVDGRKLAESNINHAVIPMTHRAPPEPGDLERCIRNLPLALEFIHRNAEHGPVLLHCRSGKDRTGLVAAAYLVKYCGFSPREAIQEFCRIRPIAYSSEGWMDFAYSVVLANQENS